MVARGHTVTLRFFWLLSGVGQIELKCPIALASVYEASGKPYVVFAF